MNKKQLNIKLKYYSSPSIKSLGKLIEKTQDKPTKGKAGSDGVGSSKCTPGRDCP